MHNSSINVVHKTLEKLYTKKNYVDEENKENEF